MKRENLDIIILLVTVLGFYFAYLQWFRFNRERKLHLLKILRNQHDCITPFKNIYNAASNTLSDSTFLDQM